VTNCTFRGNFASDAGGGMFNRGNPTVTNCTFAGNFAAIVGGGMYNPGSAMVTNCTFSRNVASFIGGMYASSNSTVTNCVFSGNHAYQEAGGMLIDDNATVTNCTFNGNTAELRGGGMASFGYATVTHCTFAGNFSYEGDSAIDAHDNTIVANCIIWGNSPAETSIRDAVAMSYSNIQGGFPGVGNIDLDPRFVDADGADDISGTADDDLRLSPISPGSPCIDAGANTAVPPDAADLDGDEDTNEPTPIDLNGDPRFIDDPIRDDCPQPGADCGAPR